MDSHSIKEYFPEGKKGFAPSDEIVLARVFLDKAETMVASSILRVEKIPHFIADTNSALFTDNVMSGERLFVRKEDLERVGMLLEDTKQRPYTGEEDWYKEVRTQQGYAPYRKLTFGFIIIILIMTLSYIVYNLL